MPTSTVVKTATRSARNQSDEKAAKAATHRSAIPSSTAGYWVEIGNRHPRHLPRSTIQLTIGTFSYHVMARSQRGQRERGRTTDRLSGQRDMHTFKNEPTAAPVRNANVSNSAGGIIARSTREFPWLRRH